MKTQRASETKEQITPRTCTICSKNIGGRNYTGKMMVCSEKCKQTALLFGAQEEELVVYLPIEAALRKVVISAIKNRVGPKDITQFIDHTFQFMPPLKSIQPQPDFGGWKTKIEAYLPDLYATPDFPVKAVKSVEELYCRIWYIGYPVGTTFFIGNVCFTLVHEYNWLVITPDGETTKNLRSLQMNGQFFTYMNELCLRNSQIVATPAPVL